MKKICTIESILLCALACLISLFPNVFCEEISKNGTIPATATPLQLQLLLPQIPDLQVNGDSGLQNDTERLKRAQGPITELYGCLVTLFLNPLCWNKFENNRLRYLQYLYLRRKLMMMEDAMKKNQTAAAGMRGSEQMPRGSASGAPGRPLQMSPDAQPEPDQPASRLAQLKKRFFPRMYAMITATQKRVEGLQKQLLTQAQQLYLKGMGQAQQILKRTQVQAKAKQGALAQAQTQFPMMMMRT